MIVDIAIPDTPTYVDVCLFAHTRYAEVLNATISAAPDSFAYAHVDSHICGCLGLYLADRHEKLQLELYFPAAFETISGIEHIDRKQCGELGTRAIKSPSSYRSADVSTALAALIMLYANAKGIRYLGFTSNRTSVMLARSLDLHLVTLGKPDLSFVDASFRENWKNFFRIEQTCFGFQVASVKNCLAALKNLDTAGIRANLSAIHSSP